MRRVFAHDGEDFFEGQRVAIRAFGAESVEDIRDGENASGKGELLRG